MNIAAFRNSALSSIDELNNLPTWKGGAWPGGSSASNSGVSGLGVSGQYLQGLINLISDGNISLIQNGQQITISGNNQSSQLIGSYVSGLGIENNLLTGAIVISGLGSISISQNGQIIYFSGISSQTSDYFGVTGIRVSGDSISGAISFTQAGNIYLIQNGNNIIISGKESLSTGSSTGVVIGGVTGVGVSGNFTTGGINLKSAGSITLIQNGQDITISGDPSSGGGGTVISSTGDGIYISLGNTGGQILNSGVFNAINWNSGIRSGILSFNQTEPSKIYIQTGCSGYYSISAYVNLNNNDLFDNYVWKKNGTNYLTNKSSNIANAYLNDGDYLEFYVNPVYSTSISGNISCDISNIKTIGGGSSLGGVTGVGVSGNYTTGGINLLSAGSITLIQSGQNITISGIYGSGSIETGSSNQSSSNLICNLYINVDTPVTGVGGRTQLRWSGARFDNSNNLLWSASTPSLLKAPFDGLYRATLSARFTSSNDTAPHFLISGDTSSWGWRTVYSPTNNTQIWSADLILKSGSYAEAQIYTSSNVTLSYDSGNSPLLTWQKIG